VAAQPTKTTPELRAQDIQLYLQPFGEVEKFSLAKWLLFALGLLFLLGGIALLGSDQRGEKVFEACTTIIPPIATLVIGYYFGEKSKSPRD
jgi:hypothetical protein